MKNVAGVLSAIVDVFFSNKHRFNEVAGKFFPQVRG